MTIITVDLYEDTLEKIKSLGLDLLKVPNKTPLADIKSLQQQPGDHDSPTPPRP